MRDRAQSADFPRRLSPSALYCAGHGFFEWKAIKGTPEQPYASAGSPTSVLRAIGAL